MKRVPLYLLILIIAAIATGCDKDMKTEQSTSTINTELGILPKLISLPKQPKKVLWQVTEQKGKDNGTLVALLSFSDADYDYIVQKSQTTEANIDDVMDGDFYEKWVPEKLRQQIKIQKNGDRVELIGIKRMKPDLFTQAEISPFKNGSVTPLGEGYLLVSLYSM